MTNNKQIANTEVFAFIAILVSKLWSRKRNRKSVLINQFVLSAFCLCFTFTGINFRGMLHHVCDVAFDKNMCGPIKNRKCRSTNILIIYVETDNRNRVQTEEKQKLLKSRLYLKSDSYLPKFFIIICFNDSPLKMMKNAFYFILNSLFILKIFKFLS